MKHYLAKFKKQTNFTTQIVAVVLIVLFANFVSYQLFWRWDVTENKAYSLSDASIELMEGLDDVVNVKVYVSDELPPQLVTVRQAITDTLQDYKTYAGGNLHIDYLDPKDNEDLKQELLFAGIPEIQFNVMSNNKYELSSGYMGIMVTHADRQEVIPFVQDAGNLELQLTSAIAKVVDDNLPTIGFLEGDGEYTLSSDLTIVNKALSELYDIQTISLAEDSVVPKDIDALVIAGTTKELGEAKRYAIDQFVMRGGSLLVLQEGVTVDLDTLAAQPAKTNINSIIEPYGITINQSLVLDTQHEPGRFNGGGGQSVVLPYPFFVMATADSFNGENPIVSQLKKVVFPWVSPLAVAEDNENVSVLARTTNEAWTMADNYDLSPQGDFGFTEDPKNYPLIALHTGPLHSAFTAKPTGIEGEYNAQTDNGKVMVVGGSRFITDTFLRNYPQNGLLFQNAIDFLASDRNLISIRAKQVASRPLEQLDDAVKARLKYLNIYGVTALVLLFGIGRYMLRKRKKL